MIARKIFNNFLLCLVITLALSFMINCGNGKTVAVTPPATNGGAVILPIDQQKLGNAIYESNLSFAGAGQGIYTQLLNDHNICGEKDHWNFAPTAISYNQTSIDCNSANSVPDLRFFVDFTPGASQKRGAYPGIVELIGRNPYRTFYATYGQPLTGTFHVNSNNTRFTLQAASEARVRSGQMLTAPLITVEVVGSPIDLEVDVYVYYQAQLFAQGKARRR